MDTPSAKAGGRPVRMAPSEIPSHAGPAAFVIQDVHRSATRTLTLPLEPDFTNATLRTGQQKLAQAAAAHGLQMLEQPLFALHGHPLLDPQESWSWEMVLPVQGLAKVEHDEVGARRMHGGTFIASLTEQGVTDLGALYVFFFEHHLPKVKHRPTRPCVYHRIIAGSESADPRQIALAVYIPVVLTIESQADMRARIIKARA